MLRIGARPRAFPVGGSTALLHRDENGVMVIDAASELELVRALGFAHAVDRGLQLLLVRLIGQGRLSELDASEANLGVDVFMRQMGFAHDAEVEAALVGGEMRTLLLAYGEGVSAGLAAAGIPLELRLVRYEPTGPIERIIELPVSRGTSVMFGGPDLSTLYITTMRTTLDERQLSEEPLAGCLLAITPGVRGLAETPFAG